MESRKWFRNNQIHKFLVEIHKFTTNKHDQWNHAPLKIELSPKTKMINEREVLFSHPGGSKTSKLSISLTRKV